MRIRPSAHSAYPAELQSPKAQLIVDAIAMVSRNNYMVRLETAGVVNLDANTSFSID